MGPFQPAGGSIVDALLKMGTQPAALEGGDSPAADGAARERSTSCFANPSLDAPPSVV